MAAPEKEILVGGQAVLEGVMMKLPRAWAVTVRRTDGSLAARSGPHVPWTERWPILRLPLLRGVATLFSMLGLGMRALFFSSDVMARDLDAAEKAEKAASEATADDAAGDGVADAAEGARRRRPGPWTLGALLLLVGVAEGPDGTEPDHAEGDGDGTPPVAATDAAALPDGGGLSKWELAVSIGLAIGAFLLLFKALPLGVAWLAARVWPALGTPLGESVISGLALAAVFIGYLSALSLVPDIRRVFQYHGAEHKVVYLHEAKQERTIENARPHSTLHPRCGTSFLFFVVVTSIVVWSLFPVSWGFLGKLGLRLALFPLVVGLSFELIRLSARHRENLVFRALMAPGLWSQRITTKPPDDSMLAVSLHSLGLAERECRDGQAA